MTTTAMATKAARAKKIGETGYYATATGLKLGSKGRVRPAGDVLAGLSKGEARRLRKALRAAGEAAMAGARRGAE